MRVKSISRFVHILVHLIHLIRTIIVMDPHYHSFIDQNMIRKLIRVQLNGFTIIIEIRLGMDGDHLVDVDADPGLLACMHRYLYAVQHLLIHRGQAKSSQLASMGCSDGVCTK